MRVRDTMENKANYARAKMVSMIIAAEWLITSSEAVTKYVYSQRKKDQMTI